MPIGSVGGIKSFFKKSTFANPVKFGGGGGGIGSKLKGIGSSIKNSSFGKGITNLKNKAGTKITDFKKSRADKKAAAAQAAPQGQAAQPQAAQQAGQPQGWSTTGSPESTSRFSKDNLKKAGFGATIGGIILGLIAFFAQLLGFFVVPGFALNLVIFGALALVCALFVAKSGNYGAAFLVFIIIGGLGYGSWFLQATPLGKEIGGKIGIAGIGVKGGLPSLTGPLTIMSQIFTGTYNPSNLWSSDQVQSDYSEAQDVGVRLIDVRPLRDQFTDKQPLSIQGRLDAVSFPKSNVSVNIEACTLDLSNPADIEGHCEASWNCVPASFDNVRQVRNRPFTCNNDSGPTGAVAVKLTVTAINTTTVAGKQFIIADPDALLALPIGKDPLDAWGISKDSVRSWQAGDPSLGLGIGVSGDMDVLEAGPVPYYLGVNVENPMTQTGSIDFPSYAEVSIYIPKETPNLHPDTGDNRDFPTCEDYGDATNPDPDNLGLQNVGIKLLKCTANIGDVGSLSSSKRFNKFLGVTIQRGQLAGQDFSTFFVMARVRFNYVASNTMAIEVVGSGVTGS